MSPLKLTAISVLAACFVSSQAIYPHRHALDANFPTVGRCIFLGQTAGSGVVISDRHVLTAQHVSGTGFTNVANKSFQLGSNSPFEPYENPNPILPVGVIHLAPISTAQYPHSFNTDLAIWEFPANTFSQWSKFALGDYPLGTVVRYAGYGRTAQVIPFAEIPNSQGIRRWGENVISLYSYGGFQIPSALFSDFDANGVDTYQDGGPIEFESGIAAYDSGGPTFVWEAGEWKIIGINGAAGVAIGGTSISVFTKYAYLQWIIYVLNPGGDPTP